MQRRFSPLPLLLFLLALIFCRAARAGEPSDANTASAAIDANESGQALRISLLTMGPGEHPFTKFGHTAIWVHDASSGRDEVYNYGTFAFDSPTLALDSVQGNLPYWLSVQSLRGTLLTYREQGRSLLASELDLTPGQRAELYAALRRNALPEHRYYRYDYYRDNCATRVRDVIDRVIGGQLHAATRAPASMSFRAHTLRLVADSLPLYVALDLGVGRETDAPITFWDEGFLPARLHDMVLATRLVRDGKSVPLVLTEQRLLEASLPLPATRAPRWFLRYLLCGILLGGAFVVLGRSRSEVARRVLGGAYAFVGIGLSLLGCALSYLTFFSAHSAAAANYNVLATPVWLLALLPVGIGVARDRPRAWTAARWLTLTTLLSSAIALALHALTPYPQANGQILAVALPLWIGLTFSAWQRLPRFVANL